MTTGRTRDVH